MRRTPIIALLGAGTSALAAPAAAQAGVVLLERRCYVEREPATAILTGFTPGATVELQGKGVVASGVTDAAGSLRLGFPTPTRATSRPGSDEVVLTASERTGAAPQPPAGATLRVTTFGFATSGGTTSPRAVRTWTFSGFQAGRPIFGHFRFKGRTRANFRFGVAKGPCGELRRRAPGLPVRGRVSTGTWRVQVDQRRRYSRLTTPRLATTTTIVSRFVPRVAGGGEVLRPQPARSRPARPR